MNITIASKNPIKIEAVKEMIKDYPLLAKATVSAVNIDSDVADQPKSLNETVTGAIQRAKKSHNNCDYSFGIESGIHTVPHTKTGYMDVCVCAIYDGKEIHLGLSSSFEFPVEVMRMILEENKNASEAFKKTGLTDHPYVGHAEGAIGILTKGRLNRKAYTKQAIQTALIHLENKELY